MSLGERSASNKVRSRQAVSTLQGKLRHLEDVMEITGHTRPDGSPMTREMTVVFPSHLKQKWNGNFEVNLIFDDPEIYAMTLNGKKKFELVVQHVNSHGDAYIMTVSIKNTSFIMKCNAKELSSRYQSFYSEDRIVTVIQREVEGYKYASNIPELKDKVIPMYAHGNLVQLDQGHKVTILREWEVILLKKGSGMDLFNFARIPLNPPTLGTIKMLTTHSFKMLRDLHKNGITHGDAKVDQFIWSSDDKIGSMDLCWLDFGRCLINKNIDIATWNLRRLADINLMLCVNAFSAFTKLFDQVDYTHIDMGYVRENIQGAAEWERVDNLVIKDFLLPAIILSSYGGICDVDRCATEYVFKKFYRNGNIGFLEALEIDRFFKFLLTGDNLFKMTKSIFSLAGRSGQIPYDFYEEDMIRNNPRYSDATQLSPQQQPGPQPARFPLPPPQQQHGPQPVHLAPPPPQQQPGLPPVQQTQVSRYLVYHGHMLCSPNGQPYNYFMRRGSVILLAGQNQVAPNIMPCFTIINGGLVQLQSPPHNHAPLFFFLHPGMMDLLINDGGRYVKVMEQPL